MARTKVYTHKELEEVRQGGPSKRLLPGRAGVFWSEGNEVYVLVEPDDPDHALWLHPTGGLVNLYNTHQTAELRWDVAPDFRLGKDDLTAVLHYGLTPADMSADEWRTLLDKQKFALGDLAEEERELIRRTDERGKGKVRRPPDEKKLHDAIYQAMNKGLIYMEAEMSGGGGPVVTFYRLTPKGRRVKAGKKNPKGRNGRKKIQPRRRRSNDVRTRARNDRLRRILRGV